MKNPELHSSQEQPIEPQSPKTTIRDFVLQQGHLQKDSLVYLPQKVDS